MIIYFSGTGNSRYVAELLAKLTSDELVDIAKLVQNKVEFPAIAVEENARTVIGFVMPVYAWGVPSIVSEFIKSIQLPFDEKEKVYTYVVFTHGDDMGFADWVLSRQLKNSGIKLNAVFSVSMPNTYVCLPGFDIDSDDQAKQKVDKTTEKLSVIADIISKKKIVRDVHRGLFPFLKTYVIRPLFNKFLVTDKYFKVTTELCVSCGRCSHDCPLSNIDMVEGTPRWKGNCTGCLRCFHQCLQRAIEFGKYTKGKGQKRKL